MKALAAAVLSATVLLQWACCAQLGPVVSRADLTRSELLEMLGPPSEQAIATVDHVIERFDLEDSRLPSQLRQLPAGTKIEALKWKEPCWSGHGDYFIAVLDPATGQVLRLGREPLTSGRTNLR